MFPISPGLAQAAFELLELLNREPLSVGELISSFRRLSGLPTQQVLSMAQELDWIQFNEDGVAVGTSRGKALTRRPHYAERLRQVLLDYVDSIRPPWLQNALSGRARVMSYVGAQVGQVFVEAEVVQGTDDSVVAFWDSLAARARGQTDDRLTAIGRQGERLSLAYELARTGNTPKWISLENNGDGYDILSIVDSHDSSMLSIEVKTSTRPTGAAIFLTRNEWTHALDAANHCFHVWLLLGTNKPALAILEVDDIIGHVPRNAGSGEWTNMSLPLGGFSDKFAEFSS